MPFHSKRRWSLGEVPAAEKLARMLTEQTWCCCDGFSITGHPRYLFLNDATSPDGAQEYAVIKRLEDGSYRQVESVTFSWSTFEWAGEFIEEVLAGAYDDADYACPVSLRIETPEEHGACPLCM